MVDNNEYMRIVKKNRKPLFKYCYYRLMNNVTLAEETLDDILKKELTSSYRTASCHG